MLNFKALELSDIDKLREYFCYPTITACDYTIGSTFMWREFFSIEYAVFIDTLIIRSRVMINSKADITAFNLPIGKDKRDAIAAIDEYCSANGTPVALCIVTEGDLPLLSEFYSDFELFQDRDWSDYVYRVSDIVTLGGRKYHGQRNQISHFKRAYPGFSYEVISPDNLDEVTGFYEALMPTVSKDSDIFAEEQVRTLEVLNNFDVYGMSGGLIRVGDSVAAFSIGEVCGNTLYVHIEKADLRYKGVYQVMNNEFAKHNVLSGTEFVNRGEDVGDVGLRVAKSSYHPCGMIDKYIVVVKK